MKRIIFIILLSIWAHNTYAAEYVVQDGAITFSSGSAAVLDQDLTITVNIKKCWNAINSSGEEVQMGGIYKYGSNYADIPVDPVTMTWNGDSLYTYHIANIRSWFNITSGEANDAPQGINFWFHSMTSDIYLKVGTEDNKDNIWLPMRNNYKIDFFMHEQEGRKVDDVYRYYTGEVAQLYVAKYLLHTTTDSYYKSDEVKYRVNFYAGADSINSIPATATYGEGQYVFDHKFTSAIESASLTATAKAGGSSRTAEQTYTITVHAPIITLSLDNATIHERGGEATTTITATIPAATTEAITIPLNISGATENTDYELNASSITIAANATSGSITLTAKDNHAKTGDKTITIEAGSISSSSAATFTCATQLTATIIDADKNCKLPVTPIVPDTYVCKGDSSASFTISNLKENTTYSLWSEQETGSEITDIYDAAAKKITKDFNASAIYYLQADSTAAAAGCQNSLRAPVNILVKQKPNDFTYDVTKVSAGGTNDGAITLTAGSNGEPPYTLTLTTSGATKTIDAKNGTATFENLTVGTYSVNIVGSESCGDTTISNIEVEKSTCAPAVTNPAIDDGAQNICHGTATTLQVSTVEANTTYYLYDSENQKVDENTNGTFNIPTNQTVGTYHLIAENPTLADGCQTSSKVTVLTVKATPDDATAEVTQGSSPIALLGKIKVTAASQGAPFSIQLIKNDAPFGNAQTIANNGESLIFENLAADTYKVIVSANGCEKIIDNLTIENCTAPLAPTATAESICKDSKAEIVVTNYNPALTYSLHTAAADGAVEPSTNVSGTITTSNNQTGGTLYLMASNASALEGCKNSPRTPVTITVANPTAELSAAPKTCVENSGSITVNVSGGTTFAESKYSMKLGEQAAVQQASGYEFVNLSAGSHTVLVTDSKGCTDSKSISVVNNNTQPAISATPTATQSEQNNGKIVVKITAGEAPFTVSIGSDSRNNVALDAEVTFSNLAANSYTVQATGANGCSNTQGVTVGTDTKAVSFTPLWAVHGDSLVVTLNTAGTGLSGTLQNYNMDDVYIWAGVTFAEGEKYISATWEAVPPAKLKMKKTGEHKYRFVIRSIKEFYELSDDVELGTVKGFKYMFRSGGDSNGGGILEGKDNGADFYEDLHSFRLDFWINEQEERKLGDTYHYYVGESANLKLEKYVDGNLNSGKEYPVDILLNDETVRTIPASQAYDNGVFITTYAFNNATSSATLRAAGYSIGGAVANSAQLHRIAVHAPIVTLSRDSAKIYERNGNDTCTITANIAAKATSDISIPLSITGATLDTDYTLSAAVITIDSGKTEGKVKLAAKDNHSKTGDKILNISTGTITGSTVQFSCSDNLNVTLVDADINCKKPNFTYSVSNAINGHDGSITLTAGENGTPPFTLTLNPGEVQKTVSAAGGIAIFDNLGASFYSVTITGSDGCGDTTITSINVASSGCEARPASPYINDSMQSICYGTSITLEVSNVESGTTYMLCDENQVVQSNQSGIFNLADTLAAGEYYMVASDTSLAAGCQTSLSIPVLTVKPRPVVELSVQHITTENSAGAITVNVSGGTPFDGDKYNMLLNSGDSVQQASGYTFGNLAAGSYTIQVAGSNGCANSASAAIDDSTQVVVVKPAPVVSILQPANNATYTTAEEITIIISLTNTDSAVLKLNNNVVRSESNTDGFTHTFPGLVAGTHTILVQAINKDGKQHSAQVNITVSAPPITSVAKNANDKLLLVYPNPAKGKVYIRSEAEDDNATIDIYTGNGILVKHDKAANLSSGVTLRQGAYFVRLNANGAKVTKKLVVE